MAMSLEAYAKFLAQMQLSRAAIRGLRSAGFRCVNEIVTFIIPSRTPQPVDRSLFRGGWKTMPTDFGCTVENMEPHAVFIEEGVTNIKIGRAMIDALAEWAIRKGIATKEESRSRAWAIAKSMEARGHIFGVGGMGILRELVEGGKLKQYVEEEVKREVERELTP